MKGYTINFKGLSTDSQLHKSATGSTDIIKLRETEAVGILEIENLCIGFTVIGFISQANDNPSTMHILSGEPLDKVMVIFARGDHSHLYTLTTDSPLRRETIEGSGKQKTAIRQQVLLGIAFDAIVAEF